MGNFNENKLYRDVSDTTKIEDLFSIEAFKLYGLSPM